MNIFACFGSLGYSLLFSLKKSWIEFALEGSGVIAL